MAIIPLSKDCFYIFKMMSRSVTTTLQMTALSHFWQKLRQFSHLSENRETKQRIQSWDIKITPQLHTHAHPFNGPYSGTTRVSQYQKVKTNLDFTEARDSEWKWHQLEHMQVCTSLQTDNHASTPPLSFL